MGQICISISITDILDWKVLTASNNKIWYKDGTSFSECYYS